MVFRLERHLVFGKFEEFKTFDSLADCHKYIKSAYRRHYKRNTKANADFRPNAYGPSSLPWFKINGQLFPQLDEDGKQMPLPK